MTNFLLRMFIVLFITAPLAHWLSAPPYAVAAMASAVSLLFDAATRNR